MVLYNIIKNKVFPNSAGRERMKEEIVYKREKWWKFVVVVFLTIVCYYLDVLYLATIGLLLVVLVENFNRPKRNLKYNIDPSYNISKGREK